MKLFSKISVIKLIELLLILSSVPFTQAEIKIDAHELWDDALNLFVEGSQTSNPELLLQARDKLSTWIEEYDDRAGTLTLAKFLNLRAVTFIALGEPKQAIADYKRAIQYNPVAEVQLGICFLEKQQGAKTTDLKACYDKAVEIFAGQRTHKTNPNYLIARILSGDKTAIEEYKNLIETEPDTDKQETYKMTAQRFLDNDLCQQILTTCEQSN